MSAGGVFELSQVLQLGHVDVREHGHEHHAVHDQVGLDLGAALNPFGFVNLFGNFFPIALAAMRTMPVIGDFLRLPGISLLVEKLAGERKRSAREWA